MAERYLLFDNWLRVIHFLLFDWQKFAILTTVIGQFFMEVEQPRSGLSRNQKTGFVLLLIFAVLAVGLGVLQLRNTIYGPFVIRLAGFNSALPILNNEEARLQSIDTDHDTLNDWEELNYYQTSPYLADTDSDDIADNVEIAQGGDPLCPKGEKCESEEINLTAETEPMSSPLNNEEATNPLNILGAAGIGVAGQQNQEMLDLLAAINDPKKLREMLIQTGGISAGDLAKIDDGTLTELAKEMIAAQLGGTVSGTSTIATSTND